MSFLSFLWPHTRNSTGLTEGPHRSYGQGRKSRINTAPKSLFCTEQNRGACQTTQQISSCLWEPWNSTPLEENTNPPLISSLSCKQGSRQQFNSIPGFLRWPCYPICFWALESLFVVVHKQKAAIRHMGWASGVPQRLKKVLFYRAHELASLSTEASWAWSDPVSCLMPGRRFWDFISWHHSTVWARQSLPPPCTLVVLHPLLKLGCGCLHVACSYLFSSKLQVPPLLDTTTLFHDVGFPCFHVDSLPVKNHISSKIPFI